jgi:hypothetical protein
MVRRVLLCVLQCLCIFGETRPASASGSAPVAEDISVTSLFRADSSWTVITTLTFSAKDVDGKKWTFALVHPEALADEDGTSRVVCPDVEGVEQLGKPRGLSLTCRYQPVVNSTRDETFQYTVTDDDGNTSQPATVKVSVKRTGLRWELLTNGSTALTSDSALTGVPDVLGKSTQDFLFRLDWEVADPRGPMPTPGRLIGTQLSTTRSVHIGFETGIVNQPEGETATTIALQTATAAGAKTAAAEGAPILAIRRQATFGGEFNYNAVMVPDSGSTYLELGALFKGNMDASIEGASTTEDVETSLLTLTKNGTGVGSFRGEAGFRFAIKQYADDSLTTSVSHNGGHSSFPKNSDNLVTFECGYLRDTSLVGLSTVHITENRYLIRATASPELPGIPGHVRPTIGMEVTGGFSSSSPKSVKFLYGINAGALGLFH